MNAIEKKILDLIDRRRGEIIAFGEDIWHHAEIGYKEHRTAERFAGALAKLGLRTETGLAVTGVKGYLKEPCDGPTVAVMGELDALPISQHKDANPETGASHCCGHHAQLAGVIGAAIALSDPEISAALGGNVVFFGVPAEEFVDIEYRLGLRDQGKIRYGGGKCELIRIGALDDVDITVGHHSSPGNHIGALNRSSNGFVTKLVCFSGRSAHAAGTPEKGIDALAASSVAMHAVDAQRETFRDGDTVRIYGYISRGGEAANVIADRVTMEYLVRAKNIPAITDADQKVNRALAAGAVATGCGLTVDTVPGYLPIVPVGDNSAVLSAIRDLDAGYPVRHAEKTDHGTGSTDYGDLSSIMPLLQFGTGGFSGTFHNSDVAVTDPELAYIVTAKLFALTACKLLQNRAEKAGELLRGFTPLMTKQAYLDYMEQTMKRTETPMQPLPLL